MIRKLFIIHFLLFPFFLSGQQIPFYTQTTSTSFLINPAIAGTKKSLDLRIGYRNQWTGFDGAPVTEYASLNSRLFAGRMGLGVYAYKDETGPISRTNYTGAYAFHLRFPDVELSIGLSGSIIQYQINGSKITIQTPGDLVIDQTKTKTILAPDVGTGFYIYNDRFHFGASALGLLSSTINDYGKGSIPKEPGSLNTHFYLSLGYNYSGNPDFIWENNAFATYVKATPIFMGYSLRMFYKRKIIIGTSIRLRDAIALNVGYVIADKFHISYSYDVIVSHLRPYNGGSHEVMLAYSVVGKKKIHRGNDSFQRQKYGYMF